MSEALYWPTNKNMYLSEYNFYSIIIEQNLIQIRSSQKYWMNPYYWFDWTTNNAKCQVKKKTRLE